MDISVIVPTYKPQDYILHCIHSLFEQTLDHRRFEVIIVLNGCGEPYLSWLQGHLSGKDGSLRCHLLHSDLGGVSRARNLGLEAARGQYITFLDDDDWVSPSYLADLLGAAHAEAVVVADVADVDGQTGETRKGYMAVAYRHLSVDGSSSLFATRHFLSTVWGKLIPRDIIASRRFDARFSLSEDALFMATVSDRIRSVRKAPATAVYHRLLRTHSASRTRRSRWSLAGNAVRLSAAYMKLYVSAPRSYGFWFILSRVAASWVWVFRGMG